MAEHLRHFLRHLKHIPVNAFRARVYITSPGWPNFLKQRLLYVCPQYITCLISSLWRL